MGIIIIRSTFFTAQVVCGTTKKRKKNLCFPVCPGFSFIIPKLDL